MSMRPIGSTQTGQPGPWIMLHVRGQQVLEAVAGDRVGVAAAELHEMVVARRIGLARDRRRDRLRERAVAIFVDVFHGRDSPIAPANSLASWPGLTRPSTS